MSSGTSAEHESLLRTAHRLDRAFAEGRDADLARLFSLDARLMWTGREDIVGRESIAAAFGEFFARFDTRSFSPDREIVEVFGNRAFTFGRFTEVLTPKAGGFAEKVYGRLVEAWSTTEQGDWQVDLMLTSRYAENETIRE